ncbi:2-hydroxychromene-2-carboxylate isomerase [Rhizobium viscosum]|uniref:2-hydroxychromene-2-carboxylate isomerase n=1 Tax=Rhizobium viscosum TaxID=1673 RepID=A0ABR9IYC2_RHIVS|nr:2-hydroxychromene-2-carboxylate isomerase [Rhizobium viscosum]MBE1508228.1 2-hydroxychromene-2-carboxylate isomerase [Rhizobium viscosum]
MTKTIDYFFGIGSPWSFIGLDAFSELAQRHGVSIRPHAISVIEDNGGIYSRNRPEARRAYWTKDLKRWAALRGKTLNFENRAALSDPTPAGFMVIAAIEDGLDWLKLTRALQAAFWTNGDDIGRSEVRQAIAEKAGFDGARLEERAQSEAIQSVWRSNIEAAKSAGIFGLPTFRYEDELYWGQDSLPFLERHLNGEKIAV